MIPASLSHRPMKQLEMGYAESRKETAQLHGMKTPFQMERQNDRAVMHHRNPRSHHCEVMADKKNPSESEND